MLNLTLQFLSFTPSESGGGLRGNLVPPVRRAVSDSELACSAEHARA